MFHLQTYHTAKCTVTTREASKHSVQPPARPPVRLTGHRGDQGASDGRVGAPNAGKPPLCVRTLPAACCVFFRGDSVGEARPPAFASVPPGERKGCSDVLEPRTPCAPRTQSFRFCFSSSVFALSRFSSDSLVVVLKTGAGRECDVPALCRIEHYQRKTPQPRAFNSLFNPCSSFEPYLC